ncbi:MAG: hypothetical protein K0U98_15715 [Deltaproteobacteria bacterium]|nr:hypothetical protein [Deltaproteobacteria bacterium]
MTTPKWFTPYHNLYLTAHFATAARNRPDLLTSPQEISLDDGSAAFSESRGWLPGPSAGSDHHPDTKAPTVGSVIDLEQTTSSLVRWLVVSEESDHQGQVRVVPIDSHPTMGQKDVSIGITEVLEQAKARCFHSLWISPNNFVQSNAAGHVDHDSLGAVVRTLAEIEENLDLDPLAGRDGGPDPDYEDWSEYLEKACQLARMDSKASTGKASLTIELEDIQEPDDLWLDEAQNYSPPIDSPPIDSPPAANSVDLDPTRALATPGRSGLASEHNSHNTDIDLGPVRGEAGREEGKPNGQIRPRLLIDPSLGEPDPEKVSVGGGPPEDLPGDDLPTPPVGSEESSGSGLSSDPTPTTPLPPKVVIPYCQPDQAIKPGKPVSNQTRGGHWLGWALAASLLITSTLGWQAWKNNRALVARTHLVVSLQKTQQQLTEQHLETLASTRAHLLAEHQERLASLEEAYSATEQQLQSRIKSLEDLSERSPPAQALLNVAYLIFVPTDSRGPEKELLLPPSSDSVYLLFELGFQKPYEEYRLVISSEESGTVLWKSGKLHRVSSRELSVVLPTEFLPEGKLNLTLFGLGQEPREKVGEFSLQVSPKA